MQQVPSQQNQTPQGLVNHLISNWNFDSCNKDKLIKIAEVLCSKEETDKFAQFFFVSCVDKTLKLLSPTHKPEDVLDQVLNMVNILTTQQQNIYNIHLTFENVLPVVFKVKGDSLNLAKDLPEIANSVAVVMNYFEAISSKNEAKPLEIINSLFTAPIAKSNSDFDLSQFTEGLKELLGELKISGYSQVASSYFILNKLNGVQDALNKSDNKQFSPSTQFKLFAQTISKLRNAGSSKAEIDTYFESTLPSLIIGSKQENNINALISEFGEQVSETIKNLRAKRYLTEEISSILMNNIPKMAEYGFLSNETKLKENLQVVEILHYGEINSLSRIKDIDVDSYALIASATTANSKIYIPITDYARRNKMDLELLTHLQRTLSGNHPTEIIQTTKVCNEIYKQTHQRVPYSVLAFISSIALHIVDKAAAITDGIVEDIANLYSEKLFKTNPIAELKAMNIQIRGSLLASEFRYLKGALDAATEYFSQTTYMARKILGQDGNKSPFAEFLDRISTGIEPLKYKFDKYPGNGFLVEKIDVDGITPLITSEGVSLIDGADYELSKIKTLRVIHFRGFLIINNPALETEEKSLLILNNHLEDHIQTKSLSFLVDNKEVDVLISDIKSGKNLPENLYQFLNYFPHIPISLHAGIDNGQRIDFSKMHILNKQDPRIYYSTLGLVKTLWLYNLAFSQYKKGAGEEVTGSKYDALYRMYDIAKQAHDAGFEKTELRITNTYFGKAHLPNNLPSVDLTTGEVLIDSKKTHRKFRFDNKEHDLALFRELFFPFWATPHLQLNITAKE